MSSGSSLRSFKALKSGFRGYGYNRFEYRLEGIIQPLRKTEVAAKASTNINRMEAAAAGSAITTIAGINTTEVTAAAVTQRPFNCINGLSNDGTNFRESNNNCNNSSLLNADGVFKAAKEDCHNHNSGITPVSFSSTAIDSSNTIKNIISNRNRNYLLLTNRSFVFCSLFSFFTWFMSNRNNSNIINSNKIEGDCR